MRQHGKQAGCKEQAKTLLQDMLIRVQAILQEVPLVLHSMMDMVMLILRLITLMGGQIDLALLEEFRVPLIPIRR